MGALAVVIVDNVTPERFARIQQAAAGELGQPLTGTSGTASSRGAEVSYVYAGANTLTLTILKVPTIFGHPLIQPAELQMKLLAWVQSVK